MFYHPFLRPNIGRRSRRQYLSAFTQRALAWTGYAILIVGAAYILALGVRRG